MAVALLPRVLSVAVFGAALVLPHVLTGGDAESAARPPAHPARAAAQVREDCVVSARRITTATVAALAAQAALVACGSSTAADGQVAALSPWVTPVPYFPPREATPAASGPDAAARARPTTAPARTTAVAGGAAPAATTEAATARPAAAADPAEATVGGYTPGSGAPSDAEVQAELDEAFKGSSGDAAGDIDRASLTSAGLATIPVTAPPKVAAMINAGNAVAHKPYVYGGGHGGGPEGTFSDSAYDCSGSVSYSLASAGFVKGPMVSGALASWGKAGPGKWVSIYANDGHVFMVVAGLRFDTSGRSSDRGSRWQVAPRSTAGFTVRHPPGL